MKSLLCSLLLPLAAIVPQKMQAETSPLSRDINTFAFSLYNTLNTDPSKNALFSPYSIFSCLSLVYLGAKEDTAEQMASVLHFSLGMDELPLASARLSQFLTPKGKDPAYALNIANALWVNKDNALLADYQQLAQDSYGAKVENVDFHDTEAAVSLINQWTSDQTQGKIPDLLKRGDLSALTRLVLTNALYFKGAWSNPFDPNRTEPSPFFSGEDIFTSVPMMEQTHSFPYYEDDRMQLLALPYAGSDEQEAQMACVFFLPKTGTLDSLEQTLTAAAFHQWMGNLDLTRVQVKIPTFTLKLREDLSRLLEHMGMKIPFSHQANFTGLIEGMSDLYLSKVLHEAFFAIDEQGVTAAAATAAVMCCCSAPAPHPTHHYAFIADHPFLFAIVELQTQTILFLGKYTKPN